MKKVLTKKFFERESEIVAKELIGKYLVRQKGGKLIALKITETESYGGIEDLASHARRGITSRTKVMFGDPGVIYMYLIYGMYHMLNIVTSKKDVPGAVLIRAVEGLDGPGKLTKKLNIHQKFNGLPLSKKSGLWIEDRGGQIAEKDILKSKRIGVEYAGEIWANKLLRFSLE